MELSQAALIVSSLVGVLAIMTTVYVVIRTLSGALIQLASLREQFERLNTALERIATNQQELLVSLTRIESDVAHNKERIDHIETVQRTGRKS